MKVTALVSAGTAALFLAACGSPAAAPATPAAPAKATSEAPAKATTEPTTAAPVKMPNAVGMVLQDAQDLMQKVTGNPLYVSKSHDVLHTRMQVLDSGWQVCTQSIKEGELFQPDKTIVDFGVVKEDESCR